ncbi:MAG: hypothetical protein ACT4NX_01245 [Deltaproteobacteria bacterium]
MAISVQELTKLVNESDRAKKALDFLLDYVDLVKGSQENLPFDTQPARDGIGSRADEIDTFIAQIKSDLNSMLDNYPVDEEEVAAAAKKFMLLESGGPQAENWIKSQQRRFPPGSYWWRYWEAIADIVLKKA